MKLLDEHFEITVETPDGIGKLRRLILTLAVQGKLLPQNAHDQPASELLKDIEAEKKRLLRQAKIRDQKPLHPIGEDDIPFPLPEGWRWVRLGTISTYIQRGKGPKYAEIEKIPVISQKSIRWSGFDINPIRFIDPESIAGYQEERLVRVGDLLWNSTGTGTIGRVNLYQGELARYEEVVVDSHVTVVRTIMVNSTFILRVLMSPFVQDSIEEKASGTTNQIELNTTTVANQLIALPPLAEQKRIVAKIDQLMSLCDRLEAERNERDDKRLTVHAAAMNRLLTAPDKPAFNKSWNFITKHFEELYSVTENVAELNKGILQLAVMGKLVPQDPNDQPASELLKEIASIRDNLAKQSKLKTKANPVISEREEYLGKPDGWEYCRLGNLATFVDYRGRTPRKVEDGVPLITAKNVRSGFINREPREFISRGEYESWMRRGFPRPGDILFTTEAPLGNVAVINIEEDFALAQRVICFQVHKKEMAEYLKWFMMSIPFQNLLRSQATGMTATGIKAAKLKELPILLPPIKEQKRVVNKLKTLNEYCDELEGDLSSATGKREVILDAVLARV